MFGTLRGALFAFGDDVLLDYRARADRFHPFRPLEAGEDLPEPLREVSAALTRLRELHHKRNQRPVAATIAALLDASRAHAIFALRPSGDQALANVQYVGELARQDRGGRRPVVPRLRRAAARGGGGDAGGGSADSRGGERRRPADDGAQGQRPRVPGRRAGGHRRRAVSPQRVALGGRRGPSLCGEPGGVAAGGAAGARAARGVARSGGRDPRRLRRGNPRPRPAGRLRRPATCRARAGWSR